ncbi:hypothetical protein CBL_20254 [Carabus blaptoides fortunei]
MSDEASAKGLGREDNDAKSGTDEPGPIEKTKLPAANDANTPAGGTAPPPAEVGVQATGEGSGAHCSCRGQGDGAGRGGEARGRGGGSRGRSRARRWGARGRGAYRARQPEGARSAPHTGGKFQGRQKAA